MFIWTSIAHMVLPLGETGVKEMGAKESPVMEALQSNLGDAEGFYIYPGPGLPPNPTREQRNEAMKHMAERLPGHPTGILIYHPADSRPMMMGRWLTTEFLTELLEALLVVGLLAQTGLTSFGGRVAFVFAAGVMVALGTNISYWNWYGFPGNYTVAYMLIQIVGFLCVGVVAALILRKASPVVKS